jgi:hypothetical protein
LAVVCLALTSTPLLAKVTLSNGTAAPRTGTTTTNFTFRVTASGRPQSVIARLTGPGSPINVDLSGPANGNGVWSGTHRIPTPGRWTVTFITPSGLATTSGGTVSVTAAPTPTPRPTPKPTPTPVGTPVPVATPRATVPATAKPAATPQASQATASATAAGSASPRGTAVAVVGVTVPTPTQAAVAAAGGLKNPPAGSLWLVMLLGLLVIMGVGGIALLAGRRTAEEEPMFVAAEAGAHGDASAPLADQDAEPTGDEAGGASAAATAPGIDAAAFAARVNERADGGPRGDPGSGSGTRTRRAWEVYSGLDDQPIGTVDQVLIDAQPRPWDSEVRSPQPPEEDETEET